MIYHTEVYCPTCEQLVATIEHVKADTDTSDAVAEVRKNHAAACPECMLNPKWMRGMLCEVYEVEDIPVKVDVPLIGFMPYGKGPHI